jgi:starch synthase
MRADGTYHPRNPVTDPSLYINYARRNYTIGKRVNKEELQKDLGLPVCDAPMIGFVGRLDYQKGADLVLEALPWMVEQGCQVVALGRGDKNLEQGFEGMEGAYPDQARGLVAFDVDLAHKMMAACDILLMPSR